MSKRPKVQQNITAGSCFLPSFCTVYAVFAVVITAVLLALILALSDSGVESSVYPTFSRYFLFILWVALTWCAIICALRDRLCMLNNLLAGFFVWLLILVITLVVSEASIYLVELPLKDDAHIAFTLKNVAISAIVAALILHYLYLQFLWRQQVVAESQAHLQSLQSRIRPHFLFNSMNTIASLTRSNPELAEEAIHDLSDLFRASLSDAKNLSTLGEELDLARGYLRIETQRLGNRLQITWDLEELPLDAKIPALMLQPLLENAVYHGIEPSSENGSIEIVGRYRRKRVNISIRNSQPKEETTRSSDGNKLALENIRQRLQGFFHEDGGLAHSEVDGDYQVRLFFPHPWTELT